MNLTTTSTKADWSSRALFAQQAAAAKERAASKVKQNQPSTMEQLPLWPDELCRLSDDVRCLPNEIFRSALFNARNRNLSRAYLKQSEIVMIGNGRITYTGEELRQDDETVWLQLLHMAKKQSIGQSVKFTPYGFCKAIDWTISDRSYARLRKCLDRMQATSLAVYSSRLKDGVSLSMIPVFRWQDGDTGQVLRRYQVQFAPQLVELFGSMCFTCLEWAQRKALPDGIATWLHGYFASHRIPLPIKISTLARGAGMTTERAAKVRELIEKALRELVNVGFLISWEIVGELVHVKRKL